MLGKAQQSKQSFKFVAKNHVGVRSRRSSSSVAQKLAHSKEMKKMKKETIFETLNELNHKEDTFLNKQINK